MKYTNEHLALVRALLHLSGKTSRQVAIECGVVYTNFSSAIRGVRSFPEVKWPLLMSILGMEGNQLNTNKVHFWQVGADIDSLQVAIAQLFPHGVNIEGVWRSGGGIWDMKRVMDNVLFALTDGVHRVLVKRSGVGFMLHHNPLPISPETIPQLTWRTSQPSANSMLAISNHDYANWDQGEISIEAFDVVWQQSQSGETVYWEQVIAYAERNKLSPQQVLDILKKHKVNHGKWPTNYCD